MFNNSYGNRFSPAHSNKSVSPYRVIRVSQSPNRNHYSPMRQVVQQPIYYQNHPISPSKINYVPQNYNKITPSQVYYTTSPLIQTNSKPSTCQQPPEQYNVWDGYESKKDISLSGSACSLQQQLPVKQNKVISNNNPIPKNVFYKASKQQVPNHNYYAKAQPQVYYNNVPPQNQQMQQIRNVSPMKNDYRFIQNYR